MVDMLWNHLWQSTVCAGAVALLTLAFRRNRAHVRYWLWLAASVNFLVPFSALVAPSKVTSWAVMVRPAAAGGRLRETLPLPAASSVT